MSFQDKVVIVTGASSGIGEACVHLFAAQGARVVACARSTAKLDALARAHEGRVLAVTGDVAIEDDIQRLFVETERAFGACEILVNNAGMTDPGLLEELTPDRWDRLFDVNVRSLFLTSRAALPAMKHNRRGAIINIASISGVPGPEKFPGWVSYCSSKGAVISFTEALAVEVREYGIRVNCISPGSVDTPMWHAAAPGVPAEMTAEEIARIVLFLASDDSRPMNGQNVNAYSV